MTKTNKKEFSKIWEGEFKGYDLIHSTIDQADFIWDEEWEYGTEAVYKGKVVLSFDDKTPKDVELRINENKKALWKIIIDDKEHVIFKFDNDYWLTTTFNYNDKWLKVEKKRNRNDDLYFKVKISRPQEENMEDWTKDEETIF